jgi:uncharacterized protein YjbI with pentapeptide repeats
MWVVVGFVFPAMLVGAGFAIVHRWAGVDSLWPFLVGGGLVLAGTVGLTAAAVVFLVKIVRRIARTPPKWTGFGGKTLWNWLELLIIPIVLALGAFAFSLTQDMRTQDVEDQRAQDAALQAYIDEIENLMLNRNLEGSRGGDTARVIARARTVTVMHRLDADGNRVVVRFLREAGLIGGEEASIGLLRHTNLAGVDLEGAALSGADLTRANLRGANLNGAVLSSAYLQGAKLDGANLRDAELYNAELCEAELPEASLERASIGSAYFNGADLSEAHLFGAFLSGVNLFNADLDKADLRDTYLFQADLRHAILTEANLTGADLTNADLRDAYLHQATLRGADLRDADLRDAYFYQATGVTTEQLKKEAQAHKGASMPNDSQYHGDDRPDTPPCPTD